MFTMLNFTGELCGYVYITPNNSFMYYCVICENNFESSKEFQNHNLSLHFQVTSSGHNNDVDFKDIEISNSEKLGYKNKIVQDLSDEEKDLNIPKELHVEIETVELNDKENEDNEFYKNIKSFSSTPCLDYDTENEEKYTTFLDQSELEQKLVEIYNKKSSNLFPYGLDDLDEKNLQCKYCNKQFSKKYSLIEHTKNHFSFALTCKICGKHSDTRTHAETHDKTHVKMICSICGANFSNENTLEIHLKKHNIKCTKEVQNVKKSSMIEKLYKCDICSADLNHIICEHNIDIQNHFPCELCGKKFKLKKTHDWHIKKFHKIDNLLQCEICDQIFENSIDLKRHMKIHNMEHSIDDNVELKNVLIFETNSEKIKSQIYSQSINKEKKVINDNQLKTECNLINFEIEKVNRNDKENKVSVKYETANFSPLSTSSISNETDNEETELEISQSAPSIFPFGINDIDEIDHKCKYCFKQFTMKSNLIHHTKEHLNFILTCKVCGKHSSRKSHARLHEKIHNKEKCYLCEASFSNEKALEKHMKRHEMLRCKFCSKEFKKFDALHNHLRTHTGEKPFKCDVCSAAFAIKRNLQTHIVTQHTGDIKNFSCKFCDRKFKTKQLEDWHTKRVHLKEKPHICEICGLNFANMSGLRRHKLKRHTEYNKRPHPCQLCDKRFVELKNLTEHMNTHTGEKPFQCDICSKSFGQQSSLREHKKLHTGKKTHICKICGKAFAQHSGCSNHMKQHHMISNIN